MYRRGFVQIEAAADDLSQENAVVARVGMADGLAFQMPHGPFQHGNAPRASLELEPVEYRFARLETAAEMLEQRFMSRGQNVQHEGAAGCKPLGDVPVARTATETMGGSKPACITQLASMPLSCSPCRTVSTNKPLGIRPRTSPMESVIAQMGNVECEMGN